MTSVRRGLGAWSAAAAAVLLRLTPPFELNHDCGWYLFVATRWLAGDRLYIDLVEVNPPLVVYLSTLPALVALRTGWPLGAVFHTCVLGLIAVSLWLCRRVLHDRECDRIDRATLWVAGVVVLVVWPGGDFGQREHCMVVTLLPWLVAAAARTATAEARVMPPGLALGIGLFAAVGVSLKPYFLLAPLLVRLGEVWAVRRWRFPLEDFGLLLGVSGYAVHLLCVPFRDGLLATIALVRQDYSAYSTPLGVLFAQSWTLRAAGLGVGLGVSLLWSSQLRRPLRVLALAWSGLFLAALWQGKGWSYHLLPAELVGLLGVALLLARLCAMPRLRLLGPVFAVLVAGLSGVRIAQHALQRDPGTGALRRAPPFTGLDAETMVLQRLAPGDALLLLDTDMHVFFGWMAERRLRWASRYACLWRLPAALRDPRRLPEFASEIAADLRHHRPRLVLVRRGTPAYAPDGFELANFVRSQAVLRDALADYRVVRTGTRFLVLSRP
ncbi:MAG: hypothetical protein H6836_06795 [Planctomycetes bacterium]|nr:hypothetical protein [Planctomycetota bacterium]MCB9889268.1 hypothetical protein [Planctomycetota bacterium]